MMGISPILVIMERGKNIFFASLLYFGTLLVLGSTITLIFFADYEIFSHFQ